MAFMKYKDGNPISRRVPYRDKGKDEKILVEQHHQAEVNINAIVKRHGIDLIEKVARLRSSEFQFDDVSGNDFQEAMNIVMKAKEQFDEMPSKVRARFDNDPAQFLDFVQNPANLEEMYSLGLAVKPKPDPVPAPIQVQVVNPETPPTE